MSKGNFDETDLTMMFHSRAFTVVATIIAVLVAIALSQIGGFVPFAENRGIAFNAIGSYISDADTSLIVSLVVTVGTALFLVYANGKYTLIRGFSFLFAAIFMIAMVCCPPAVCFFYGGATFCLLTMLAAVLLISVYQQPERTKEVFLAFFLLSLGACFHWGQLVIAAVFFAGCGQMMIFKPKVLLAAIFGLVTPLWILIGFGIVAPTDLVIPTSHVTLPIDNPTELSYILTFTAFSGFLCIVFGVLNILKFLSADTRTRSVNGFIFLLTLASVILAAADYANLPVYIPIINCFAALQTGQFFAVSIARRSYIPIIIVCLIYIALLVFGVTILAKLPVAEIV